MIVDQYSRKGWPYFLKQKSDVPVTFAGFVANLNAKGVPSIVKCIRSDNGTEFIKQEFVALLNERGIRRKYKPANSLKDNDVV